MDVGKFFPFFLLISSSLTFAQTDEQKISITFSESSISEALISLDNATEKQLSFNHLILPQDLIINDSFIEQTPTSILRKILGASFQMKNIGDYIIIQKAPPIKKNKVRYKIKGTIQDAETGEELKDVTIYEINTLKSTLSNEDGGFELKAATDLKAATFVLSKRFYSDTVIHTNQDLALSKPITLQQEIYPVKKRLMIRERVKNFSSGMARVFTSVTVRKNAQNVNLVDTRWIQLSLIPSIGTNRKLSTQIKNKLSLNLIAGHSYGVRGVELGGFYNIDREEARGVQVGGFGNTVGGEVKGVQMGGFINTSRDYVKGMQAAGFLNVAKDSVEGLQVAGFTNFTREMTGFQVAGFSNHVNKMSGFQLSGFINTTKEMDGFQLAGLINVAKKLKGLQLGIVNVADTVSSGIPLGIINIIKKNGFLSPTIESTDVIPYQFAFRMGIENFYSLIFVGTNPSSYWSLGGGFGTRRYTSSKQKFFLNPELRWHSLAKGKIEENEDNNLIRLDLNLGYKWFKRLSVKGGPSINFFFTNQLNESGNPELVLTEATLFEGSYLNNRYQFWVGYSLGVGF
ncbi:MAG: hypothetical protein AAF620_13640 [Bacteroidota bacterium]